MKKITAALITFLILLSYANMTYGQVSNPGAIDTDNKLTNNEIKEGWKLLFDGKTSTGWMNARTKTFPTSG